MTITQIPAGLAAAQNSPMTVAKLDAYVALLCKWNPVINLVAPSTLKNVGLRHIADSAQLFDLCPMKAESWVDFGSGGGFPAMVIAILAAEHRPHLKMTMIEADQRKAVFLQTVSRETQTTVDVLAQRIEKVDPLMADVVSARAVAPLPLLCAYARRHLKPQGVALFQKGAKTDDEVALAKAAWRFDLHRHPSVTDRSAVILEMKGFQHV